MLKSCIAEREDREVTMIQKLTKLAILPLALGGIACLMFGGTPKADEYPGAEHLVSITQGGLLYDNWYEQIGVEAPKKTHPSYPATGKQKGAATWRCKECHGWDYKGSHGAYAKGSHFTGISGIRNMTHASLEKIIEIISNKTHGYGDLIPKDALTSLAHFVAHGQVEMDEYIDRDTKKANGNSARGARIFQTVCVRCHGKDGKAINFKTKESPEYIGTVANANPWEVLHKIRNGQPAVQMISMLAFSVQDHVDVLAYAQTLPVK